MAGFNAMAARFRTTNWSLILRVDASTSGVRRAALAELCEAYWYPLYSFARRRGSDHDDASDLTQAFFVHLIEKHALSGVAPTHGRFRSFLLASFKHFQSDVRDRRHALKRGGDRIEIPWDAEVLETRYRAVASSSDDPEKVFDRQWALILIERVRARLRTEYVSDGKTRDFEVLLPYLTQHGERGSQQLAAALGTTEGAARVVLHRFKRRFGSALRAEVASTVDHPEQVESELRFLLEAVGGSGRPASEV
jgi:RNA polymerase sigma factor (sigma-70 family)